MIFRFLHVNQVLLLLAALTLSLNVLGQNRGYLELRGRTLEDDTPINAVKVVLQLDGEQVREVYSDAKGRFTIQVGFGANYQLYFRKNGYVETYLEVLAAEVDRNEKWIASLTNIIPPLIPDSEPGFPAYLFQEQPYAKVVFSGRRSFEPDLDYYDAFQQKVLAAQEEKEKLREESVEKMVLAGRIIQWNDQRTGASMQVIHLRNPEGEIIQTFVTNEEGAFVFTKLPIDKSFLLTMDESDLDPGAEVMLVDEAGKPIQKGTVAANGTVKWDFVDPIKSGAPRLYTLDKDYRIRLKGKERTAQEAYEDDRKVKMNFKLVDQTGEVLHTTNDTNVLISFVKLLASNNFFLQVDDAGNHMPQKTTLIITDSDGGVLRELRLDELDKFNYELLPSDEIRLMIVKADDGELVIAGNLITGDNPSRPLAFKKILLVVDGQVIETAVTNQFGGFIFTRLKADKPFVIRVAEPDDKTAPIEKFILTNAENEEVAAVYGDDRGNFEMNFGTDDREKLESLIVSKKQLRVKISGFLKENNQDGRILANEPITLTWKNGTKLAGLTDENGRFVFTNLPADKGFKLKTGPIEAASPGTKVALVSQENQVVKSGNLNDKRELTMEFLPSEVTILGRVYVEDPWVDLLENQANSGSGNEVVIAENIYFAVNDHQIQPGFRKLLDKVVQVLNLNPSLTLEVSSHTDSRGSDAYNLQLSERRANAARDYLLKSGIASNRIVSKGYGETRLINECGNGNDCPEDLHAQNRRVEFKVSIN